jgi:ribonuclease BN (tRNA processing enzyme)
VTTRPPAIHIPNIVSAFRFSGDTQPTEVLAEVGKGANLLIHEATMADDQADLARIKAHSTVGQAIEIGRKSVSFTPSVTFVITYDGDVLIG